MNPRNAKYSDLPPAACVRTGLSVEDLKQSFVDNLFCDLGRVPVLATLQQQARLFNGESSCALCWDG